MGCSTRLEALRFIICRKGQRALLRAIKDTDAIAWDIQDLESANFLVVRSFELIKDTPIHSRIRLMARKHNIVEKKERKKLLKDGIILSASQTRSFQVDIAANKDGRPHFCGDYRQLSRS